LANESHNIGRICRGHGFGIIAHTQKIQPHLEVGPHCPALLCQPQTLLEVAQARQLLSAHQLEQRQMALLCHNLAQPLVSVTTKGSQRLCHVDDATARGADEPVHTVPLNGLALLRQALTHVVQQRTTRGGVAAQSSGRHAPSPHRESRAPSRGCWSRLGRRYRPPQGIGSSPRAPVGYCFTIRSY